MGTAASHNRPDGSPDPPSTHGAEASLLPAEAGKQADRWLHRRAASMEPEKRAVRTMSTRCARALPPRPRTAAPTCPEPANTHRRRTPLSVSGWRAVRRPDGCANGRREPHEGAVRRCPPGSGRGRTVAAAWARAADRVRWRRARKGFRGPRVGLLDAAESGQCAGGDTRALCAVRGG